jgi:hypothetical protein
VLDVILSPEVDTFVDGLPQPEKRLTRGRLRKLSDPGHFLRTTRPLVGQAAWRVATVGPFEITCQILTEAQARASDAQHPALVIATIDRTDALRRQGDELVEEAEEREDDEDDDEED